MKMAPRFKILFLLIVSFYSSPARAEWVPVFETPLGISYISDTIPPGTVQSYRSIFSLTDFFGPQVNTRGKVYSSELALYIFDCPRRKFSIGLADLFSGKKMTGAKVSSDMFGNNWSYSEFFKDIPSESLPNFLFSKACS